MKRIHGLFLLIITLLLCSHARAHGYVTGPPACSYLCGQGGNTLCGAIQYEPQSLEGPPDAHIASANLTQFAELDEQTSSRWSKRPLQSGQNNFTWNFTANHVTRQWRYYITKQDWNPNARLSRASFDLTPFCTVDGGMRQPPSQVTHSCTVPQRTGY